MQYQHELRKRVGKESRYQADGIIVRRISAYSKAKQIIKILADMGIKNIVLEDVDTVVLNQANTPEYYTGQKIDKIADLISNIEEVLFDCYAKSVENFAVKNPVNSLHDKS